MALLKVYEMGERLMACVPILGKMHHSMSKFILDWCKQHKFVRFDNLRAPNQTDDDIKRLSGLMFCIATFFFFCAIYEVVLLNISSAVAALIYASIPYTVGVVNMEALKIERIITEDFVARMKKDEEQNQRKTEEIARPLWMKIFSWLNLMVYIGLFYITFWHPEKIEKWVTEYGLYDYVKDLGIQETHVAGVFAVCVFLAYVIFVRIIMFLIGLMQWSGQKTTRNYSKEKMKKYDSSNFRRVK